MLRPIGYSNVQKKTEIRHIVYATQAPYLWELQINLN